MAVGDFNKDGSPDLVTANYTANNVSVLLGDGSGGFGSATNFPVGTTPWSVTVGDLNRDGNPDLVTANYLSDRISVLLGNGSGSFGSATIFTFPVGTGPTSVAVGDFNKDGNPDLATANYGNSTVSVLLGNGSGGFGSATSFPVGRNHLNSSG